MRVKHWIIILFSGALWFVMGLVLMTKGMKLIIFSSIEITDNLALISHQRKAIIIIASGILIGFIKGRYILVKKVARTVKSILSFEITAANSSKLLLIK